jgi:endonuclease/exonuclease/phosphatase family metal-dependent hydrolase
MKMEPQEYSGLFIKKWRTHKSSNMKATAIPTVLKIVTWNTWFDNILFADRNSAQLSALISLTPDVIALQECTAGKLEIWMQDPWIQANYVLSVTRPFLDTAWDSWYGTLILVRKSKSVCLLSVEKVPFQGSRMGRNLVMVDLLLSGRIRVSLGTAHFESGREDSAARKHQWEISTQALKNSNANVNILCGDFNIYDDDRESEILTNLGWQDCWLSVKNTKCDHTNQDFTFGDYSFTSIKEGSKRRLDRVLFQKQQETSLTIDEIRYIGKEPIKDTGVYPSDHLGVYVQLTIT